MASKSKSKPIELKPVTAEPRYSCLQFIRERCKDIKEATAIAVADFDALAKAEEFSEGPFIETFGDGYGEPYNMNRQVFGKLKDGRVIYADKNPKV